MNPLDLRARLLAKRAAEADQARQARESRADWTDPTHQSRAALAVALLTGSGHDFDPPELVEARKAEKVRATEQMERARQADRATMQAMRAALDPAERHRRVIARADLDWERESAARMAASRATGSDEPTRPAQPASGGRRAGPSGVAPWTTHTPLDDQPKTAREALDRRDAMAQAMTEHEPTPLAPLALRRPGPWEHEERVSADDATVPHWRRPRSHKRPRKGPL